MVTVAYLTLIGNKDRDAPVLNFLIIIDGEDEQNQDQENSKCKSIAKETFTHHLTPFPCLILLLVNGEYQENQNEENGKSQVILVAASITAADSSTHGKPPFK